MRKTMTSLIALGLGAMATNMAKGNNMMSKRNMKKLRKKMRGMF
jgi:hypothetical protein